MMKRFTQPALMELPCHLDPRGNLSVLEEQKDVPFKIERVHWIYDVPGGGERWGHAYKTNAEMIVALSGSFDVIVSTPEGDVTYHLNRSYLCLYVPPMTWRKLTDFSTNSVALVLSSEPYDENDYIYEKQCLGLQGD